MTTKYEEVIQANIDFHTVLSEHYSTIEPHFRAENIQKVDARFAKVVNQTKATKLLDLGCGTGFVINIAKKYVQEITGVDVTQAMLDKIDLSGNAKIEIIKADSGSVKVPQNYYDVVTCYSFLHHLYDIGPTLKKAYESLRPGGQLYADLEPNYYFWQSINELDRNANYDPIVMREVEMVTYKDEDIQKQFGVSEDTFNNAEYGKSFAGGFAEDKITKELTDLGFTKVDYFYDWFLGQGQLINDESYSQTERFRYAEITHQMLSKALPLSKNLFKYIGFVATK